LTCVEQPDDTIKKKPLFDEFVSKIPNHALPVNFNCGIDSGIVIENDHQFEKYRSLVPRKVDVIYGTIGSTEKFRLLIFGIMGDDIYPYLYTYDRNGELIDSLDLTLVGCGGADEFSIPHTLSQIDKDLHVILWDTIEYIHFLDPNEDYVLDSISTTVVNYRIDGRGIINKL
jgi:hypothetical protein